MHRAVPGRVLVGEHGDIGAVVRCVAVRAPVAAVLAGVGVEHGDPAVAVAVGDIDLVGLDVDGHVGRPAETRGIGRAAGLVPPPDREQPLAFGGELQHDVIAAAVAADPDVVLVIDEDPMLLGGPALLGRIPEIVDDRGLFVIAVEPCALLHPGRTAPRADDFSGGVEGHHRGGGVAAFGGRRILHRPHLVGGQGAGPLNDPDIVLAVDRDARDLAQNPVVGQRLRPGRIDLVLRRVARSAGCGDAGLVGGCADPRVVGRTARHHQRQAAARAESL